MKAPWHTYVALLQVLNTVSDMDRIGTNVEKWHTDKASIQIYTNMCPQGNKINTKRTVCEWAQGVANNNNSQCNLPKY